VLNLGADQGINDLPGDLGVGSGPGGRSWLS
jgi:hypothetical protein